LARSVLRWFVPLAVDLALRRHCERERGNLGFIVILLVSQPYKT
jgi:hypothetical protein